MSDDAKRAILARRERFIRAALTGAGLAIAACDSSSKTCDSVRRSFPDPIVKAVNCDAPRVCLSVEAIDAGPTPCLSAPILIPDAGAKDGGSGDR